MKEEKRNILVDSAEEYFRVADFSLKEGNYNSAVILYFKSLIALCDLYFLDKLGETPSSHGARFRKAEELFPEIYNLLDKDFPFYQDSYNQKMNKELAEVIKEDAKTVAEKVKVRLS